MSDKKISLPKGVVVPNHIAVVLDGNGRWARSKGLPATKGHEQGAKAVRNIVDAARKFGVHTITLWGFSTENWKRPPAEVAKILRLVKEYIKKELSYATKEGVRFYHLGSKQRLPKDLVRWIEKAEKKTAQNSKYILNIALDYGGRDEILRAVKSMIRDGVEAQQINEDLFSSYLDTAGQPYPDPDLFIRTSGEQRTSGLLPWQMVYSEFYFEQDHLPDMTPQHLKDAIVDYSRRRRRFGAKDRVSHFKFDPKVITKLEIAWWRLENIPQGTRFRDYAVQHIKQQFGVSTVLAKKAVKYFIEAVSEKNQNKWEKSIKSLSKFYKLLKEEIKLAFEPTLAASLQVQFWKEIKDKDSIESAIQVENTLKKYYAEVYRISLFQAGKIAHLRVLAAFERNLAEKGMGDSHWKNAEDYLQKYYHALKERVA